MNLNHVVLAGNIARPPEIRATVKGLSVCNFTVASNRRWKTPEGQDAEEVTFVDCTAFGKIADLIADHFVKGSPIYTEGRLRLDTWDDKQTGAKRSKINVIVENFQFIGPKRESAPPKPAAPPAASHNLDDVHDDVPF